MPDKLKTLSIYFRTDPNMDSIQRKVALLADPGTLDEKCHDFIQDTKINVDKIRRKAHKQFAKFENAVTEMTPKDLYELFQLYDSVCFNNKLEKFIFGKKYTLKFKTSGTRTFTTEGICLDTCDYTITILTAKFKNIKPNKTTRVAGDECTSQLDCLLRVMEHELTHLAIFMFCMDSWFSDQHGEMFMDAIKNLWGHTDHRHSIF